MELRKLKGTEPLYVYDQSQQISLQTGFVGHLQGDFGEEYHSSWFGFRKDWNTPEFQEDLQKVIDTLQFEANVFSSHAQFETPSREILESSLIEDGRWFGLRADHGQHAFLMRLCHEQGDCNFYCYCYQQKWLDKHITQAQKGIRFITPDYKELFHLPDGGNIRITHPDGSRREYVCRYIDDTHMELNSGKYGSLYHICQFAQQMERSGCTVTPLVPTMEEQKQRTAHPMAMEQTLG